MLEDRPHVRQQQVEDEMTGILLGHLESGHQDEHCDSSQYAVHEGLHPLKELNLYAPCAVCGFLLKYYHELPTTGDLGIPKTLARLRSSCFG